MLLKDAIEILVIAEGGLLFPIQALLLPGFDSFNGLDHWKQLLHRVLDVTDDRDMRRLVLVQLRGIDIDVDNLGGPGKQLQLPCP